MQLFTTEGRANRAPYIWHTLLDGFVVALLLFFLWGSAIGLSALGADGAGIIPVLVVLASFAIVLAAFVAELCVTIRRLHDLDRTGWQWMLSFVPFVNIYVWVLLVFQPGTDGPNRYGDDPLR